MGQLWLQVEAIQIGDFKGAWPSGPCRGAISRETCHAVHDRSSRNGARDEQERFSEGNQDCANAA
jgi:hypothetical protein